MLAPTVRISEDIGPISPSCAKEIGHILDSYAVIMAGLLLIVPGLISDVIGLLLLIPPLRRWLIRRAVGDIYDHPLVSGEGPPRGSAARDRDRRHLRAPRARRGAERPVGFARRLTLPPFPAAC